MKRLPAHLLNGLTVALGVASVRMLIGAFAGPVAAQLAMSGAIGTSLADVPVTARRSMRRVFLAAVLGVLAAAMVALLRPHPLALGFGIATVAGCAALLTAWGPAANAPAFAPVLVMIFSMAAPADTAMPLRPVMWNAVGALCYVLWSVLSSRLLERRYRTLAVAQALAASAGQLRARAALIESPRDIPGDRNSALSSWVNAEAALADSLQTARDFAYAGPAGEEFRRNAVLLQHVLEVRDQLLTSQLDLHLFGDDAVAHSVRQRIAAANRRLADTLDGCAARVSGRRDNDSRSVPDQRIGAREWFADVTMAADDPRHRLLASIVNRQGHLLHEVQRIGAALDGAMQEPRLGDEDLRRFLSPEAWQLRDLLQQLHWQSPVLRHALRSAVALGSAWFIARSMPWASHPHWLILSVAVVLRGNLEQTLARRNMRVAGTLLGCLIVVGLMATRSLPLLDLCFLVAIGVAHAFATRRYWLTATAATVTALLQAYFVDAAAVLPVGERAADTLLGAMLAWAFSFVLPSWERRRLPQLLTRTLRNLNRYAERTLATQGNRVVLDQRLARRRAYDALNDLGALLQRSSAEPRSVQVPQAGLADLLDHAQRFMAHLSMVRLTLTRRAADMQPDIATPLLVATNARLATCFAPRAAPLPREIADAVGDGHGDGNALENLPAESPTEDVHPWLQRRLQLLVGEALLIRAAANRILAITGRATESTSKEGQPQ